MPPNVLHTDGYVEECGAVFMELMSSGCTGLAMNVIRGEDLNTAGLRGLFGVGQAAVHPASLVHLSYVPAGCDDSTQSVCLVGKGIVYDTGGLSIKTKEGMPGMKRDMGGSAGVLGAFRSLVMDCSSLPPRPIHALLCLAENAVGPEATRPDDVHVMYSGKTVEINNTDAEGRLVLSDGVAYAARTLNPSMIIDMATLTGAQGIATGKRHGALYCTDETLETHAVAMGRVTGDLAHPLPYVPEFFTIEFASAIADMKNSVACRTNAQSSCAGQFIGNHIEEFIANGGKWMHIDMAYPASQGERATGYGVALLYAIVKNL
ncbi:NPEPL1, partial [Symbiodinium microadriaticum]